MTLKQLDNDYTDTSDMEIAEPTVPLNSLVAAEPFFKQIDCESGWTDDLGFARCEMGSGCSDGPVSYCVKKDCPLIDEEEADNDAISFEK